MPGFSSTWTAASSWSTMEASSATGTRRRESITGLEADRLVGRRADEALPGWGALGPGSAGRCRTRAGKHGGQDAAHRHRRPRALDLHLGRPVRGRDRLRLPQPDRGACARGAEGRVRGHGLARAAHAAGGDLRSGSDAAAHRRAARRRDARAAAGGDRDRVRAPQPDRRRDPAGEQPRLRAVLRREAATGRRGAGERGGRRDAQCCSPPARTSSSSSSRTASSRRWQRTATSCDRC